MTAGLRLPSRVLVIGLAAALSVGAHVTRAEAPLVVAPPVTLRFVHGDAALSLDARSIAPLLDPQRTDAASSVCDEISERLIADPPFEGDLAIDDAAITPLYPTPGHAVDCPALGELVRERAARGDASAIHVPIIETAPRLDAAAIDAALAEVRAILEAPITLEAGTAAVTIAPDVLRAALRFDVSTNPPRFEASLDPRELDPLLAPALRTLGEPAEDARFEVDAADRVRVVPGRAGLRVDARRLFGQVVQASKKVDRKAALPVEKGEPKLDTKKAEALQISGLVAAFTTKHVCCQPRVGNIHRMADLVDGAIVEPGQRFSLNGRAGPRTKKRGFVIAPSIGEGEMVETFGGGVSQVATTLYNAVFDAGYAVIARKPHTFWFPRYPMGVEATVSWPKPDFAFRNDSTAGVLVRVSYTNDSVTVKLYGDTGGRKVKRQISKPSEPTDPKIGYEPDESLELDETKVKEHGTNGFSVMTTRDITFADGTKKHEERKVVYRGRPRILKAHPCAIPKGEKGHRKKGCPKPAPPKPPAPVDAATLVAEELIPEAKDTVTGDKGALEGKVAPVKGESLDAGTDAGLPGIEPSGDYE